MLKIPKNSKILKNDDHFWIPHPQISLKQFSNICENEVYFFYYVGGGKMIKDFCKTKLFKKIKNGQLSFLWHFVTTTNCNFKFWKIDPPYWSLWKTLYNMLMMIVINPQQLVVWDDWCWWLAHNNMWFYSV